MMLFGQRAWDRVSAQVYQQHDAGELPEVRFRRHGKIDAPEPGLELVTASITPHGRPITQWATPADVEATFERYGKPGGAMFVPSFTYRPLRNIIVSDDHRVTIEHSHRAAPLIQLLSDGSVIQASARAGWTPDGGERNGGRYSPEGVLLDEACLGDGINSLYADHEDNIWVGYFDEGVGGNYGWQYIYDEATGEYDRTTQPIGASGVNTFGPDLRLRWAYPNGDDDKIPYIFDIYALNVGRASVWNCAYDSFAVTKITNNEVTVISKSGTGSQQLVTDGDRFAFLYAYQRSIVNYGVRVPRGIEYRGVGVLRTPDGGELGRINMHARDNELFAITANEWWKVDLDDFARLDRGRDAIWIV